ncbi:MAG: hypothetical protein M3R09_01790 [Actinomycetota bacterium]|nr:hypothetical protein [Actinomycetota bacterium]
MRRAVGLLAAGVLLAGCGEPAVDVRLSPREEGQQVLDQAGILNGPDIARRLEGLREGGLDVVALTYESEQAGCGEAFRAGGEIVRIWDADVAVVAVAEPGDFTAEADPRQRCLGVRPRNAELVPGGVRERIAEQLVPPIAARNEWTDAFLVAIDAIAEARQ